MTREYPLDVLRQYEAVRRDGKVNMLDVEGVKKVAQASCFGELLAFIQTKSRTEYIEMARKATDVYTYDSYPELDEEGEIPAEIWVESRLSESQHRNRRY